MKVYSIQSGVAVPVVVSNKKVKRKTISHTGTRTRVFRVLCIRKEVKAGYPNQLDYMGSTVNFTMSISVQYPLQFCLQFLLLRFLAEYDLVKLGFIL